MNRFFNFLFSIICFSIALYGVVTGRIAELQKSGTGGMVTREQNPELFWLAAIAMFIAGIALLLKARKQGKNR